jgi:hypothetical protein
VDVAVRREHLEAIRAAVEPGGFVYRHAAGLDMFLTAREPKARSGVHIIFIGERVRPDDLDPVPASDPVPAGHGLLIAPVIDLVRMKLTSFRLRDQVHLQDLDRVGLITAEIEAALSEPLCRRLAEVRAAR